MRHIAALGVVFLFAWAVAASGAEPDFLKTSLRFDRDALVRGEAMRLAVVLDIEEGYHINANPASADSKPTAVEPESHPAIMWGEVKYPPGKTYTPKWAAGESLSVYAGRAKRTSGREPPQPSWARPRQASFSRGRSASHWSQMRRNRLA